SPLNGIAGYAQFARIEPSRVVRGLEVISSLAARLSKIVDRTLELSRTEAGALNLPREVVDLAKVAETAVEGLGPIATMKSIAVVIAADPLAPKVLGDFDRLVQVITNLVGNAIQYSEPGTAIEVRIGRGEPLPARPAPRIEVEGAPIEQLRPKSRESAFALVIDRGAGSAPADPPRR